MHEVEIPVRVGTVAALVGAAALLAGQAGGADHPRERVGILEQLGQPGGVAAQAGVAPERGARVLAGLRGRLGVGRFCRGRACVR